MIILTSNDLEQLKQSLQNKEKWNRWIKIGHYGSLYLRRTHRLIGSNKVSCLDLANSQIEKAHQNQKVYTQILTYIENNVDTDYIYHENVQPRLQRFLLKNGYIRQNETGIA